MSTTITNVRQQTSDLLAASAEAIRLVVLALPGEAQRWRPAAGEWSPLEIVGHLITIDTVGNGDRVQRVLTTDDAVFPALDVNEIARERGDNDVDARALLDDFARTRARSLVLITGLSDDQLLKTGRHPVAGVITLGQLLRRWAAHDQEHLAQIAVTVKAWLATTSASDA